MPAKKPAARKPAKKKEPEVRVAGPYDTYKEIRLNTGAEIGIAKGDVYVLLEGEELSNEG